MFTNKKAKYYGDNKVLLDSACLSSDTKPTTGVANGSKCIEMDTGKTYMFNEEDSEWEELPSSGGGGGAEPLIVNNNNNTLDKTWQEIHDAFASGQNVLILGEDEISSVYNVASKEFPPDSGTILYSVDDYVTDSANGYPSLEVDVGVVIS